MAAAASAVKSGLTPKPGDSGSEPSNNPARIAACRSGARNDGPARNQRQGEEGGREDHPRGGQRRSRRRLRDHLHDVAERRDYLRLARAELRGDDLLLALDVANFQMSLDDMWNKGPTQEGT